MANIKPPNETNKYEVTAYFNQGEWEKSAYAAYLYAEGLRKNKRFEEALDYYVYSIYLNVSGLSTSVPGRPVDPINDVSIGPKIMEQLHKVASKVNTLNTSINKVYLIDLPFRYFEIEEFTYIVTQGITGGFSGIKHNNADVSTKRSKFADYDDDYYYLFEHDYDAWYEKYVQPDLDKIDEQQNALDADIINELEELDTLENQ